MILLKFKGEEKKLSQTDPQKKKKSNELKENISSELRPMYDGKVNQYNRCSA